jgi:hypothetical protein
MIKILLSDDNTKLFGAFKDAAHRININLECFSNWEDARIELEENFSKYSAIILDGKGLLNGDSTSEDERHIYTATNWLAAQKALGNYMPAYVYTAYIDPIAMVGAASDGIIIESIDKKIEFEVVLNKIIQYLDSTPAAKIKREFSVPLKILDTNLLTSDDKKNILDVMTKFKFGKLDSNDFNIIRKILEGIFTSANEIDPTKFLINECFKDAGVVNLDWCCRYLAGAEIRDAQKNVISPRVTHPFVPKHIAAEFDYLKTSSSILSHKQGDPIGIYTAKSVVFTLLSVLAWFYSCVEKNYSYLL